MDRLYIRSRCQETARDAMIIWEPRPTLSGKQSDENPDNSSLFNVPSERAYLESKQLFVTCSDVRDGSGTEESS